MSVDKKINYEVQGGAKNYLGKQKEVKAPVKWKSSPDSPETELAYITKAEKDLLVKEDLHGSLNGDVNRGPSGIMSLDGYGSFDGPDPSKDTGMSGAATSDAEAGRTTANTRAEGPGSGNLPPGVRDKGLDDYRNAFIAAGGGQRVNPGFFDSRNTVSPAELARAKAFNPRAFYRGRRGTGLGSFFTGGGFLGNIIRGIGRGLGFGKNYNEPTYDMSRFNNTRLYENILGPSTNPNNLDIYNEFVDDEEEENTTTSSSLPIGIAPNNYNMRQPQYIEELDEKFKDPVKDQVGDLEFIAAGMNEAQKNKALQEMGFGVPADKIIPKLQQLDNTKFFMKTDDRIRAKEFIDFYEQNQGPLTDEEKMQIYVKAGEEFEEDA